MSQSSGDPNTYPSSSFANGMTGTCLCKSISVTINDPDLFTKRRGHLCHCGNCRKISGSFASSNLIIDDAKVTIIDHQGTLKKYVDKDTGSGTPVDRYFCSTCSTPIKSTSPRGVGKLSLKMGLFPRIPAPEAEAFSAHRHEWEAGIQDITSYKLGLGGEILKQGQL